MNLETRYLGMQLKNPLLVSASPLSHDLDMARRLEDSGVAGIVMYSLFEEEILEDEQKLAHLMEGQDIGHAEANTYLPLNQGYQTHLDDYLEQLQALKQHLDIPVIASLNGISDSGWATHARDLQQAGADALELNILYSNFDVNADCGAIENHYVSVLQHTKEAVDLPIAVKLSPYFSAFGHLVYSLQQAGADAVVMFNRFYQPDIDLDTLNIKHVLQLSSTHESLLRMHWIARLYGKVSLGMAATGGIHGYEEVLKMLLVGADVAQMCSVILKQGPQAVTSTLADLSAWMEEKEYESVAQLKGSLCQSHAPDPLAFERENYLKILRQYHLKEIS